MPSKGEGSVAGKPKRHFDTYASSPFPDYPIGAKTIRDRYSFAAGRTPDWSNTVPDGYGRAYPASLPTWSTQERQKRSGTVALL
jgi:hypothetical protein